MFEEIGNQLLGLAEIGGNRLLAMDPVVLQHCAELQGSIIAIHLTDLDKTFYCHPGSWGMRISLQQPGKEVDSTIRGRLAGLVNLSLQKEKLSTSMQERIDIIGNPSVAQKFQKILTELNIDWEAELSKYTGETLAIQIGHGIRQTHEMAKELLTTIAYSGQQYCQQDIHLIPTLAKFEQFQQSVTDIRHDVDRLEAKINQLLQDKKA